MKQTLQKKSLFTRFRKSKDGVAAVEFAMVALPFFAMLFAIIETAIILFAGQLLETAVADTSRLIMTGQAQKQNMSAGQFKNNLCGRLSGLFNCQRGLSIDVRYYNEIENAQNVRPTDASGNMSTKGFGYAPGSPGDIVVVRAVYQWPVFVTRLGMNLVNQRNGTFLLIGTSVFKNEPYE